jgi:hypothetical protein
MSQTINLENALSRLGNLKSDQLPLWGSMSAQRMVEHLTDTILIASGKNPQALLVPEDRIEKMQAWLETDKPMAKNIEVAFAPKKWTLRNEEIDLAIDEFTDAWLSFEEIYENNPGHKEVHAYYGPLDYRQWMLLHTKHLKHHFEQFEI